MLRLAVACFFIVTASADAVAQESFAGQWDVTASFSSGNVAGRMTLAGDRDAISGTSEPLDENGFFPLTVRGRQGSNGIELDLFYRDRAIGNLNLTPGAEVLTGSGVLYGVPVTIRGVRPQATERQPTIHEYVPDRYHLQYSARNAPVLRIAPGDRVRTSTLDNEGRDADRRWRAMPGNTLTGPFYVEGAMPGDTLVVRLERVSLNRDTADMYSGMLDQRAVQSSHRQEAAEGWGRTWILDREGGTARLQQPGERLADLQLPLRPMIGSIGVAPPLNQALYAGDVWVHGGNMDYNRHVAGATIYLPVWHAGALLSLGDGHALQGEGEISGQGLETSLEVEFSVDLIKGGSLGQIWSEDAESVMVSGIDNSLDLAFQMATTGMARWLKENHGLNDSEVAALMSASIEYDIAEVVDTRPHVVARISKQTLAMIRRP